MPQALPYATSLTPTAGAFVVRDSLTPAVVSTAGRAVAAAVALYLPLDLPYRALFALVALALVGAGVRRFLDRPPRILVNQFGIQLTQPVERFVQWSQFESATVHVLPVGGEYVLIKLTGPPAPHANPAPTLHGHATLDNVLVHLAGLDTTPHRLATELNIRHASASRTRIDK